MRHLAINLLRAINRVRLGGSRCLSALALAIPLCGGASPAQAQDVFGFFRLLFQPTVRAPMAPSYDMRALPRRPRVVRSDQPSKPPLKPKALGEVTNPVPELLADSTLRRGDFVMFPDGLRVFKGTSRRQHTLADFEPVAREALPQATRKLVAGIRPGWNGAWSTEAATSDRLVATRNLTTGSVTRPRRGVGAD